jgi:hypothetical protein
MVVVGRVAVPIMVVVDMVAMLDGLVSATLAMDVLVINMHPMLGLHTHLDLLTSATVTVDDRYGHQPIG